MRQGALRGDLSLLRSGLSLGWSFGLASLSELARTALELESGIYRAGSLVRAGDRIEIELDNPPLRIGAFRSVRIAWDGAWVPSERAQVSTESRPELRSLASITVDVPLELGVGEGSRFSLAIPPGPVAGLHRVRIEWWSRAIPPLVWLEFTDEIRGSGRGP